MSFVAKPFAALLLLSTHGLTAQYWGPADLPVMVQTQMRQFYTDTITDAMYMCGRTNIVDWLPGGGNKVGIMIYHGNGAWDTLGLFNNDVFTIMPYGDSVVVGGGFGSVDSQPLPYLAAWVDGEWQPYGMVNSVPTMLRVINGDLYMVGYFNMADGQSCYGVSKRENGQWIPIGNIPPPTGGGSHQVFDIIEYNGQLVITGNINIAIGDDVFILEGDDWVPLGGGLVGWNSYGKRLAVYQGDLYLAGGLSMAAGDIGQCIIRWDGAQWHPVGSGLQAQLGNNGPFGGVEDMLIHNDELFVCGGFSYAGGIPARGVARWNGEQWCSVGGQPSNTVFCMGFFRDTLYINNPGTFDGQDYNFVAKFVAPEYEDNCGLWVGMEEDSATSVFTLFPNPTSGPLQVESNGLRPRAWQITDALGRSVLQEALPPGGSGPVTMDLSALPSGVYHIALVDAEGSWHTATVVRE